MKIKSLASASAVMVALTACGGGDINVNAGSGDRPGPVQTNAPSAIKCAEYTIDGVTRSGQSDGKNCVYGEAFVSSDQPLTKSITLENIGEGAHIFKASLFVGKNYPTLAAASAAGINRGGDGPKLTIAPGVTVAFEQRNSFIAIMRGSQIIAEGTASAPITFTSFADINGNVKPEEVQTWGGMIINGFAFTNACQYDAGWTHDSTTYPVITAGTDCSIQQEGTEGGTTNHYGGNVTDDNSGVLSYVVVKHAGAEVLKDNELNGINLGAVGSKTTLNNIEIYSNFDDGVEFFGGNVNLTNYVALYVRDDSIDIDQGYYGTITNALVIQGGGEGEATKTGAHCVESDGSASGTKADNIAKGYVSKAVINNLTCIISAKGPDVAGNDDPGAGINAEEAHHLTINNSIVTTAYAIDAVIDGKGVAIPDEQINFTNYCFQLEDDEDFANAGNGLININSTIFACHDISAAKSRKGDFMTTPGSVFPMSLSGRQFLESQDNMVAANVADDGSTPPNSADLNILNGFYSVPLADMKVDGMSVVFAESDLEFIGAVSADNDWTAGWTYGLHDGNRAQKLWFE